MTDQTSQPTTKVVLAEDAVLLRDGIVRMHRSAGFEVAAACPDAESFLVAVEEHRPDLVVVDVRMPPTFTSEGIVADLERGDDPFVDGLDVEVLGVVRLDGTGHRGELDLALLDVLEVLEVVRVALGHHERRRVEDLRVKFRLF